MKKIIITLISLITALLSSCATTTTGPTSAGGNTYIISRQEGAFPTGNKPLLSEAVTIANEFCVKTDKTLNVVRTHENPGPYILGNYPKATVTFTCTEPAKPEYYKILNNNTLQATNRMSEEAMSYNDTSKSGILTLSTNLRGRDDALKLIGDICSSKNVSLKSGTNHNKYGANYKVTDESLLNNKLTINFNCIY